MAGSNTVPQPEFNVERTSSPAAGDRTDEQIQGTMLGGSKDARSLLSGDPVRMDFVAHGSILESDAITPRAIP